MSDAHPELDSRFVRVGAMRIHTRVSAAPTAAAEAPPLVLVHGIVVSSRYMVPTAERLARDFRVLAPDLPGFGRSSDPPRALDIPGLADALGAWMDALELPAAVLVANSMGCQVAVDLAARRPLRVRGLVLSGPSMDPRARSAPAQIARLVADAPRERPSLVPVFLRDALDAGPVRTWRTLRYALTDRIEAKLPRVQAPALVVRGEHDPVAPRPWAEAVAALLPSGRLAEIPGAPHAVNYSAPDAFAALVRSFVGCLPRVGPGASTERTAEARG